MRWSPTLQPHGRPRIRGGVPPTTRRRRNELGSSPHPRGCSVRDRRSLRREAVVPASAGVFPPTHRHRTSHRCRPRIRGGVPTSGRPTSALTLSSPHPRGCSPDSSRSVSRSRVVPASAGVFRSSITCCCVTSGRPRIRGGVPGLCRPHYARRKSSPHPRGCSHLSAGGHHISIVVPASAGVFRVCPSRFPPSNSRPRIRGGVPVNAALDERGNWSSPHPRGCSRSAASSSTRAAVVPASAGVFRRLHCRFSGRHGRPRIRGGVPRIRSPEKPRPASSPHPRGCSARCRRCTAHPAVVPASAGVFLRPSWTGLSRPGRPRIRGGVPLLYVDPPYLGESSPHPRGCS